ncbi:abortive infection family protein [Amycolatopsis antarctica]|nr:abortive infection family protein [Amycolatopsis antarctica]
MSDTVLRDIDQMWQDELFPVAEDPAPVGGQRATRFQGYLDQVDWTDQSHVARAIRVFEVALKPWFNPPDGFTWGFEVAIPRLRRLLERDGYKLTDDGTITGGPVAVVADQLLSNLTDPAVIQDHLNRIVHAIEHDDPALAIGSAKELVESTAKVVLHEVGQAFSNKDDLPELVRRSQVALAVHPSNATVGPDGSDAVKKILGATVVVTSGVAELRNAGFGTGHGPGAARSGLGPRHARLAVNAARLWCEFMLDTLADKSAPWKQQREP